MTPEEFIEAATTAIRTGPVAEPEHSDLTVRDGVQYHAWTYPSGGVVLIPVDPDTPEVQS